jgi:hypothetical protein
MSLRGRETTEVISQHFEDKEIAARPSGARNDKTRITTQSLVGEGKGEGKIVGFVCLGLDYWNLMRVFLERSC